MGADKPTKVSVRFISATNKNLKELVRENKFREDLYYRLVGTIIKTPSLRERMEDIEEIVGAYIEKKGLNNIVDTKIILTKLKNDGFFSPDRPYPWQGNVRELQTIIRNIILDLPVSREDYHSDKVQGALSQEQQLPQNIPIDIIEKRWTLDQVADWYMHSIYDELNHNQSAAAKRLGINRGTLKKRINKNDQTQ